MPHFKILTTAAFAAMAFTSPAFAQDTDIAAAQEIETSLATPETDFTSADLNQDDVLSADEFVTYAVMRAEAGDADFTAMVLAGDYDTKFTAHDADASGDLNASELGHAEAEADVDADVTTDEEMSDEDLFDEMPIFGGVMFFGTISADVHCIGTSTTEKNL